MRSRLVVGLLSATTSVAVLLGGLPAAASTDVAVTDPGGPASKGSSGSVLRVVHDDTGRVTFLAARGGHPVPLPGGKRLSPVAAARAHLSAYGSWFGVRDQARELRADAIDALGNGGSSVRFRQVEDGAPVLAGELVTVVDRDGGLVSVNGETSAQTVSSGFLVAGEQARTTALAATSKASGIPVSALAASSAQQWMFDPALVGAPGPAGARPVFRVEVRSRDRRPLRQLVLVDAVTGGVRLSFNQAATDLQRQVCDLGNVENTDNRCPQPGHPVIRSEGQTAVAQDQVNRAYDYSGKVYDFFAKRFGRDGIDGSGTDLVSSVRYCPDAEGQVPCQYQNAFWDGEQVTYGDHFADADDVVAHELTHGVTENESGLLYYYESGAINESMSDVLGELVDLSDGDSDDLDPSTRWLVGEDLPFAGMTRDMADPHRSDQPSTTSDPRWDSDWLDSGGVHTNSGVGNKAAQLITDGGTFDGRTVRGLGLDKAAALYYRVDQLLTSGADYRDLYNVLQSACLDLTGTTPLDRVGEAGASGAVTADDCAQVKLAAQAVEMEVYPVGDAKMPAAPAYCAPGYSVSTSFSDGFESALRGNWTSSGWRQDRTYQPRTSAGAAAYAEDDDSGVDQATADPDDRRLAMARTITLPAGRSSFLRFDHAYALDWWGPGHLDLGFPATPYYWDGGFVEVSVNGGTYRLLPVSANGYNHAIQSVGGTKGFGGDSTDWYTSRATLSSFAGKQVRLRFRLLTDGYVASSAAYGWWLDNVKVYSCKGPGKPASVRVANARGPKARLTWHAARPNPGYSIASYVVKRSGARAKVVSRRARHTVFKHLERGKTYTFTIYARNSAGVASATVRKRLRIT